MTEQPTQIRDIRASILHAGLGPCQPNELEPRLEAVAVELSRLMTDDMPDFELDAEIRTKAICARLSVDETLVVMERYLSIRSQRNAELSVRMDALARRMCSEPPR